MGYSNSRSKPLRGASQGSSGAGLRELCRYDGMTLRRAPASSRTAHSPKICGWKRCPICPVPVFNPFVNPFWCFFNFTPALKPPVEDNGHMLPTPGVRGFMGDKTPICRSEWRLTGLEAIKYDARTEDLFI